MIIGKKCGCDISKSAKQSIHNTKQIRNQSNKQTHIWQSVIQEIKPFTKEAIHSQRKQFIHKTSKQTPQQSIKHPHQQPFKLPTNTPPLCSSPKDMQLNIISPRKRHAQQHRRHQIIYPSRPTFTPTIH